jgi:hypothetical protein
MTDFIKYGDSSYELLLKYPQNWRSNLITDVTLTIKTEGGVEVLAADSATLWTGELNAVSAAYAVAIGVDAAEAPRAGERYLIRLVPVDDSEPGNQEEFVLSSFSVVSPGAYALSLERELRHAHADEENVFGCYAVYALDASGADFTIGRKLTLIWTPDSDDAAWTQQVEVVDVQAGSGVLWDELRQAYRSEWELIQDDDFVKLESIVMRGFQSRLNAIHIPAGFVVDQPALDNLRLLFARMFILGRAPGAGDQDGSRYKIARDEFNSALSDFSSAVHIWVDQNQNKINDDGEERYRTNFVIERAL